MIRVSCFTINSELLKRTSCFNACTQKLKTRMVSGYRNDSSVSFNYFRELNRVKDKIENLGVDVDSASVYF